MHRFFCDKSMINGDIITIKGDDASHIGYSLRMKCGEKLACACDGKAFDCEIIGFTGDSVSLRIISQAENTEPPCRIYLYQALLKGDGFENAIKRAVECGVTDIVPFSSAHCIAKVGDGLTKKTERLEKIIREAAMQSGRTIIPKLHQTLSFANAVLKMSECSLAMICHEGKDTQPIAKLLEKTKIGNDVAIAIGPEGGFSENEVQTAKENGILPCGLGKRILRAETASTFALSCITCMLELR